MYWCYTVCYNPVLHFLPYFFVQIATVLAIGSSFMLASESFEMSHPLIFEHFFPSYCKMLHTSLPASWEICMQVKKQQLELDMEQ